MSDQQKSQIKEYINLLNKTTKDDALLDFVIDTTVDRILLYLNERALSSKLNRIVAQVVVGAFNKANAELHASGAPEQAIRSVSDNGQSVTYADRVKGYMANSDDDELFSGFKELLKPYRRPHVIP